MKVEIGYWNIEYDETHSNGYAMTFNKDQKIDDMSRTDIKNLKVACEGILSMTEEEE